MKNKKRSQQQVVIVSLCLIAIVFFLMVSIRMGRLMITGRYQGVDVKERSQQLSTAVRNVHGKRGKILDNQGQPIAFEGESYHLTVILTHKWTKDKKHPNYVLDSQKKDMALTLNRVLGVDYDQTLRRLSSNKDQLEFGNAGSNLSKSQKKELELSGLTGMAFTPNPARIYPNGVYASHIVGFTKLKEKTNNLIGQIGIEKQYNDSLTGIDGKSIGQVDGSLRMIPQSEKLIREAHVGADIQLTLDTGMQHFLENLMDQAQEKYQAKSMQAILIKAKTGAVVASAQRPSFDPNTLIGIDKSWNNALIQETFEPGSTMKVLTLAAAINEGVFDPNERFQSGQIKFQKETIADWQPEGWGEITYLEGLARSSNVAFVNLVQKMGVKKWKKYMDAFGVGRKTGIDLPQEISGNNPFDNPFTRLTTSFGQGVSVTTAQLVQAFTAIANQGRMMPLHVYDRTISSSGKLMERYQADPSDPVISRESARKTLKYLRTVVESPEGTGRIYKQEGIDLSAKTGTSEETDKKTGKYYRQGNNYIYSVVGFFPSKNPEYIAYVMIRQPQQNVLQVTGASMVSEIFNPLVKKASRDIVDASETSSHLMMPKLVGKEISKARQTLKDNKMAPVEVIGQGQRVVAQYPEMGQSPFPSSRIFLITEGNLFMPDMTGWSIRDVDHLAKLLQIKVEHQGNGQVIDQNIRPKTPLNRKNTWEIEYGMQDDSIQD
ncbi:penicillin-binding protein [Atopobacter sp. AH10]|uniref:penicillin-binding protein n=1 Tax=Atopobacter sp. AH10 TaxID=2315861 RepID=UPI000EF24D46|nr:penicillin-binding protein [Atopobacter sp. AH10]RLK62941.1 penicillin-binding protein [Atopobacter sp. AH10]